MVRSARLLAATLALAAASPSAARAEPPPEAGPPAAAAPPPQAAAPDLRVRPPVALLADLYDYGAADPMVGERVDRLRTRRNLAVAAFGGAVLSGVVGAIVTMSRAVDSIGEPCPANRPCTVRPDYTPTLVAAGVGVGLAALGFVLLPKRSDLAETVALWNGRHPHEPVELEPAPERAPAGEELQAPGVPPQ